MLLAADPAGSPQLSFMRVREKEAAFAEEAPESTKMPPLPAPRVTHLVFWVARWDVTRGLHEAQWHGISEVTQNLTQERGLFVRENTDSTAGTSS